MQTWVWSGRPGFLIHGFRRQHSRHVKLAQSCTGEQGFRRAMALGSLSGAGGPPVSGNAASWSELHEPKWMADLERRRRFDEFNNEYTTSIAIKEELSQRCIGPRSAIANRGRARWSWQPSFAPRRRCQILTFRLPSYIFTTPSRCTPTLSLYSMPSSCMKMGIHRHRGFYLCWSWA